MAILTIRQKSETRTAEFTPPLLLSDALQRAGVLLDHPCGRRGVCGKCAVEVRGSISEPNALEDKAGARLSCQTMLFGDAEVILPEEKTISVLTDEDISNTEPKEQAADSRDLSLGMAVDIGTTTLVTSIYDLSTGDCLLSSGRENPQCAVAADVMSRIQAALEGKLGLLHDLILNAIPAPGTAPYPIRKVVIVGNTAMLYFLTRKDPGSLSRAPFDADDLFGRFEEIHGIPSFLPPCMNAFVGADITASVLASGMCRTPDTALLADIGTNGELALWKNGTLYVTSTAAGPAFEGAAISQGSLSVNGAIDRVWMEDGTLHTHVIGDISAKSICGSGLLDAVAVMLETGAIDESGAMNDDRFELAENVALLPKDIRQVQLAKSAIRAGIETLLASSGTDVSDIETFYIAGGFGSHLSPESAAEIGLVPPALEEKAFILGNAALKGAAEMLLHPEKILEAEAIAARSRHVDLGGNPLFNELFVEHMLF